MAQTRRFATEAQDTLTIAPGLRMLAQKTWQSPLLVGSYAAFLPIAAGIGHAPGWGLGRALPARGAPDSA